MELEKANHPRSSRLIALTPGPSADAYEKILILLSASVSRLILSLWDHRI